MEVSDTQNSINNCPWCIRSQICPYHPDMHNIKILKKLKDKYGWLLLQTDYSDKLMSNEGELIYNEQIYTAFKVWFIKLGNGLKKEMCESKAFPVLCKDESTGEQKTRGFFFKGRFFNGDLEAWLVDQETGEEKRIFPVDIQLKSV